MNEITGRKDSERATIIDRGQHSSDDVTTKTGVFVRTVSMTPIVLMVDTVCYMQKTHVQYVKLANSFRQESLCVPRR